MNSKNSKTNEQIKFILSKPQRLDLRRSNKHVVLKNLFLLHVEKYKTTL